MLIKEKIESEKQTNTFRRVNDNHPLDIFLGYNDRNNPTMVITTLGKVNTVESSQCINIEIFQLTSSEVRISFSLLDRDKEAIFYKFCEDIIESTEEINTRKALSFIISRWNKWKSMFKKSRGELLSEKQIQGLIGELIFLERYMIPRYGQYKAIEAWNGPSKSHKDFEIEHTWYEVKTVKQGAITVKISSIEQLDSNDDGNLEVIVLEKTNEQVSNGVCLNKLIENIGNSITVFGVYIKFYEKLSQIGYFYDEEYNQFIYRFIKNNTYIVNASFPRICKNDLPEGIVKISYDILLEDIRKYLQGE